MRAEPTYYCVFCCVCGHDLFTIDVDEHSDLPESSTDWTRSGFSTLDENTFIPEIVGCQTPEEARLGRNDIHRRRWHWSEHSKFTTLQRGEKVVIKNAQPDFDPEWMDFPDITKPESFFPFHTACLSIVEHVVSRKSHHTVTGLAALETFYQVMDGQREKCQENRAIERMGIRWDHGYYGASRYWFEDAVIDEGWEFMCADPFNVPGLTDYVLSNLQPMAIRPQSQPAINVPQPQKSLKAALDSLSQPPKSPKAALDSLPVELLDRITSYLPCTTTIHLHRTNRALCARISLDRLFWRNQVIYGSLIPFLWDLDATKCLEKDGNAPADTFWDWRLLAYTLKTEPFVEVALRRKFSDPLERDANDDWAKLYRDLSKDAESRLKETPPWGLVNRVRMTRIVEEAMI